MGQSGYEHDDGYLDGEYEEEEALFHNWKLKVENALCGAGHNWEWIVILGLKPAKYVLSCLIAGSKLGIISVLTSFPGGFIENNLYPFDHVVHGAEHADEDTDDGEEGEFGPLEAVEAFAGQGAKDNKCGHLQSESRIFGISFQWRSFSRQISSRV